MRRNWQKLSIIIPIGPDETEYPGLMADVSLYFPTAEIICVLPEDVPRSIPGVNCITAPRGRATQLNAGARAATREFLWFLHADSRLNPAVKTGVVSALENTPQALSYFNLAFHSTTGKPYRMNAWGVRLRSRLLFSPFGDQGFIIAKDQFHRTGGFPVNVPYGEDHVFAWRVRQQGIPLYCTRKTLLTSARKYERFGRYSLMWLYNRLWLRQVLPETLHYIRSRGVV